MTEVSLSPAAERMRSYRERRRDGRRCFTIQVLAAEIDELVRRGLLTPETRQDKHEVVRALHKHLDGTLRPR